MHKNGISKESNIEIEEDRNHAQIVIQISPSATFKEAKKIIEAEGAQIIDIRYLNSDSVLIKLDVMDMRSIALKLMESGFPNIKGINALVSKL